MRQGQQEGDSQRPQFGNNSRGPSAPVFPSIFPAPQLALATQIVPHFASPRVTPFDRSRLLSSLGRVEKIFPNPCLPSSDALTRYLAGYFTGFYPLVPFTHTPTFKLESCLPELCLAMLAVGAMDRFEVTPATELFYLAKALLSDSQQRRARAEMKQSTGLVDNGSSLARQLIDELRCLLCLAHFASWQRDPALRNEACVLQSLLGQSLRSNPLEETAQSEQYLDWEQWAQQESERRTKLFAFCFLGIQSISFDVPPSIWCDEINLRLPCSCPEWTAPDATTWSMLRRATPNEQGLYRDTLDALLSPLNQTNHGTPPPTPVGNYVLIHGLLQKILWTRRSLCGNLSRTLLEDYESIFESALQKWTSLWQQTPESNLEPLDPNGPLPFTSSALLSLAYVRNCFDIFPTRKIFTWAPAEIAQVLRTSPPVDRKWSSLLAAYHATNLLATLVKLGVQYFKHNQSVLWSVEATLCGLDCSVFLEKWLRRVNDTMQDLPLSDYEIQLVDWIKDVVYEGLSSANDGSFDTTSRPAILPDQIITVWSHIMQGNSPFTFIRMIGEVLDEYRQLSVRS
ncbi:fungal specific transcription factor domain-containing protein [Aspergillus alliaceus]|uniref:fungal specific transcription factor domain-containing protein n=1 Tax=Petromyces alliaceus TaxID=209559 RepID=UPI0012A72B0B|nr:uncharacterized protein BDW43DRAFT_260479 [Aspergillus alliaceus]KAB8239041.1 hypothetical protein BDW43DRAFT_260479 [Aspergillus alliaceus]